MSADVWTKADCFRTNLKQDVPVARMLVAQQGVPGPDLFQKGRIVMAHVSPGGPMEFVLGFPDHCPVGMSDN